MNLNNKIVWDEVLMIDEQEDEMGLIYSAYKKLSSLMKTFFSTLVW